MSTSELPLDGNVQGQTRELETSDGNDGRFGSMQKNFSTLWSAPLVEELSGNFDLHICRGRLINGSSYSL